MGGDRDSGEFDDLDSFVGVNDVPSSSASGSAHPDELVGGDESSTLWMGDLENWMTEELLANVIQFTHLSFDVLRGSLSSKLGFLLSTFL